MNWRKRVQKLLLFQGLSWQIVAKIDRWFVVVLLIRMFTQVAQIVTANNNCWFITCQQSGDSPGQCDHPFLTLVSVTLLCAKQPLTTPSYPPVAWPSLEIFSVKPTRLIWYDQHLPVWWTETLKSLSKQVPPQVQCQMGTWYPTQ